MSLKSWFKSKEVEQPVVVPKSEKELLAEKISDLILNQLSTSTKIEYGLSYDPCILNVSINIGRICVYRLGRHQYESTYAIVDGQNVKVSNQIWYKIISIDSEKTSKKELADLNKIIHRLEESPS